MLLRIMSPVLLSWYPSFLIICPPWLNRIRNFCLYVVVQFVKAVQDNLNVVGEEAQTKKQKNGGETEKGNKKKKG